MTKQEAITYCFTLYKLDLDRARNLEKYSDYHIFGSNGYRFNWLDETEYIMVSRKTYDIIKPYISDTQLFDNIVTYTYVEGDMKFDFYMLKYMLKLVNNTSVNSKKEFCKIYMEMFYEDMIEKK